MSKAKVLIVEDEPELLQILKDDLEYSGFRTVGHSNGMDALDFLKKNSNGQEMVDAVISDINMPKMSGIELLRQVRQSGINVPFVVYSGYSDTDKATEARSLGAFEVIEKPYDPEKLLATMVKASELGRNMKK